jgi:hypothetical protein
MLPPLVMPNLFQELHLLHTCLLAGPNICYNNNNNVCQKQKRSNPDHNFYSSLKYGKRAMQSGSVINQL